MSLFTGATKASKVYVGSTAATAVYVGSTKVWPKEKPTVNGVTVNSWNTGAKTVAMPTHSPGDLLLMYVIAEDATTAPSAGAIPADSGTGTIPAWSLVADTSSSGYYPASLFSAVATASNHTSGTWNTHFDPLIGISVTGQAASSPIVPKYKTASGYLADGAKTATYPQVTLTNSDNSSLVLYVGAFFETGAAAQIQGFNASYPTPAGYTQHYSAMVNRMGCRVVSKNQTDSTEAFTAFGWTADSGNYDSYNLNIVEILA